MATEWAREGGGSVAERDGPAHDDPTSLYTMSGDSAGHRGGVLCRLPGALGDFRQRTPERSRRFFNVNSERTHLSRAGNGTC